MTEGANFRQLGWISSTYKLGRKLVGDKTVNLRLLSDVINGSQFADDVTLYATSVRSLFR